MEEEINKNIDSHDTINHEEQPVLETESTAKVSSDKKLTMPIAIIIAGVIIALAIVLTGGSGTKSKKNSNTIEVQEAGSLRELSPITNNDHIRGDFKKAKIAVVEFSDFECPYCRQLHPAMNKMLEIYGTDVVWVYRHFPLESIHPNARPAAIASECVNELAGQEGFWKFVDGVFTYSGAGTAFDSTTMQTIAVNAGAPADAFNACINSGKYDAFIDEALDEANNAGAQGTPDLTAVNLETGEAIHIGADPSLLGQVLDKMLKKDK